MLISTVILRSVDNACWIYTISMSVYAFPTADRKTLTLSSSLDPLLDQLYLVLKFLYINGWDYPLRWVATRRTIHRRLCHMISTYAITQMHIDACFYRAFFAVSLYGEINGQCDPCAMEPKADLGGPIYVWVLVANSSYESSLFALCMT